MKRRLMLLGQLIDRGAGAGSALHGGRVREYSTVRSSSGYTIMCQQNLRISERLCKRRVFQT